MVARKKTAKADAGGLMEIELAKRFDRRGTAYLPGRRIRVSPTVLAEMKAAGVLKNGG